MTVEQHGRRVVVLAAVLVGLVGLAVGALAADAENVFNTLAGAIVPLVAWLRQASADHGRASR
jgi:hypothetical protein